MEIIWPVHSVIKPTCGKAYTIPHTMVYALH